MALTLQEQIEAAIAAHELRCHRQGEALPPPQPGRTLPDDCYPPPELLRPEAPAGPSRSGPSWQDGPAG